MLLKEDGQTGEGKTTPHALMRHLVARSVTLRTQRDATDCERRTNGQTSFLVCLYLCFLFSNPIFSFMFYFFFGIRHETNTNTSFSSSFPSSLLATPCTFYKLFFPHSFPLFFPIITHLGQPQTNILSLALPSSVLPSFHPVLSITFFLPLFPH